MSNSAETFAKVTGSSNVTYSEESRNSNGDLVISKLSHYPACNKEMPDGNRDDPSYAYCGHPASHAGEHGNWKF